MKLKVYTADGSSNSEKEFALPVFEGDKGVAALRQVVLAHQANARQGTASTKKVAAQPVKVHAACLTNVMVVSHTARSPATSLRRSIAR
jgi:hypothetical protein